MNQGRIIRERRILASLLGDSNTHFSTIAETNLKISFFSTKERKQIYSDIVDKNGSAIFEDYFNTPNKAMLQEITEIYKIMPQSPTIFKADIEELADIINLELENEALKNIQKAILRGGIENLDSILQSLAEKKITNAVDMWHSMDNLTSIYSGEDTKKDNVATHSQEMLGFSFGFKKIDALTQGIKKGELIIIGASSSTGKSALVASIVSSLVNKKKCLFFSTEMKCTSIMDRMVSQITDIPLRDVMLRINLTPEQKELKRKVARDIAYSVAFYDSEVKLSVLRANIARAKKEGYDYIVVDYLQQVYVDTTRRNSTRAEDISQVTYLLKQCALEFDIPIIALSQLNRSLNKEMRRPQLTDLRESGSIEQDADTVLLIHRPLQEKINLARNQIEKLEFDFMNEDKNKEKIKALKDKLKEFEAEISDFEKSEIIVAKNRQGKRSVCEVMFYADRVRFGDINIAQQTEYPRYVDNNELIETVML